MASDDVHEIKSRLDIVEIVSEYASLKKRGRAFWACCPFHSEKTPSFSVSPERQTFHCFGCGKGGDVITFIMEAEHLEFREALERLAERAGVTLTKSSDFARKRERIDINIAARDFFTESLQTASGETARRYLERRSLPPDVCRRFEIGWAPDSWDMLVRKLRKAGYTNEQITSSGLASEGRDGACYDRFRGRIMFPIYNVSGRLIAFGGRIIDGEGAKYLNSPESRLYNKRHNLYLLDKAKISMNNKGCAILVEGYLDAIRAHLFGYTNTAASLGTALTHEQAALIKRMAGLCYVCYDSDSAGEEAALRAMYILQEEGVTAKRVKLQGGKDPDEILLLPDGPAIFEKALAEAQPLPLFHARLRAEALNDPSRAAKARNDLLEGLSSLSLFDVTPYYSELGGILGIFPHEVQRLLEDQRRLTTKKPIGSEEKGQSGFDAPPAREYADDVEYMFCSLLWSREDMRGLCRAEEVLQYIEDPLIQSIVYALLGGETPEMLEQRWQQMGDKIGMEIIARGNSLLSNNGIDDETAEKLIDTLRRRYLKKQLALLVSKIKAGKITDREYEDYLRFTRLLKGGNLKA